MCAPWLVVLALARSLAARETSPDNAERLVEALRRQLTADNYDYMSDSEDRPAAASPAPPRDRDQDRPTHTESREEYQRPASGDRGLGVADDARELADNDAGAEDRGHSARGQLNRGDERRPQDTTARNGSGQGDHVDTQGSDDGANFKYKMLKVKRRPSSRRRGGAAYRRFLREEGDRGVAIIRLDDGPFPQFRLPKTRRQYMSSGENDEEVFDPGAVLEEAGAAIAGAVGETAGLIATKSTNMLLANQ